MKPPSSSQEVGSPLPPLPGSVLVTGASSGIGLAIVTKLATEGITVYAGIRSETDYKRLQSLPHVVPLYLDITNAEHIAYLPTFLDQHGQKLYALINNAGIADLGFIDSHPEAMIRHHFNVNVFGHMQVTNTVLPYLKKSRGRIILTGSMSGILTAKTLGLYSMGKHAIEAYSNILRGELESTGIKVSLLEPGNFKSEIFTNLFQRSDSEVYVTEDAPFLTKERKAHLSAQNEKNADPMQVANVVFNALRNATPQPRYFIGSQIEAELMLRGLCTKLFQVNQNAFGLSLAEIHTLLDNVYQDFNTPQPYKFI